MQQYSYLDFEQNFEHNDLNYEQNNNVQNNNEQNNYLNFEQQYLLENSKKKEMEYEKEQTIIKNNFIKQYPNLSFYDLEKQNNNYSTDDGCIHYKHKLTNKIYSWNFIDNEWEEHDEKYQIGLYDLFDK